VYQTLVFSHFIPSVQKILRNANFTLIPKLHRFGFQNYNTHPTQNDVILTINFFFPFKKKRKKERKKDENQGLKWGGRATPFLGKGWLEPPPQPVWGWSGHPQKAKKKKKIK
jgi:hypothetical protein